MNKDRRDALHKEYGEILSTFRTLTDIRFRLLGFLPIAAVATAAFKRDSPGTEYLAQNLALSFFGLVATIGVITYNARNDQLYNDLVGRAASIERSLGLPDGAFANRPRPWLSIPFPGFRWDVDHGTGTATIYVASAALWLFGLLAPLLEMARIEISGHTCPYRFLWFCFGGPRSSTGWLPYAAFALSLLAVLGVRKLIRGHIDSRDREMRAQAMAAVQAVYRLLEGVPPSADLERLCALASTENDLLTACARLRLNGKESIKAMDAETARVRARASFYERLDKESMSYYFPRGSRHHLAAQFVALLTDLSPRWVFEVSTNRIGRPELAHGEEDVGR